MAMFDRGVAASNGLPTVPKTLPTVFQRSPNGRLPTNGRPNLTVGWNDRWLRVGGRALEGALEAARSGPWTQKRARPLTLAANLEPLQLRKIELVVVAPLAPLDCLAN